MTKVSQGEVPGSGKSFKCFQLSFPPQAQVYLHKDLYPATVDACLDLGNNYRGREAG